jgi:hypothetical protein
MPFQLSRLGSETSWVKLIDGEVPCLVAIELAVASGTRDSPRLHRSCAVYGRRGTNRRIPEERCARRRRNRFVREVEVDVEVAWSRGGASDEASDGTTPKVVDRGHGQSRW